MLSYSSRVVPGRPFIFWMRSFVIAQPSSPRPFTRILGGIKLPAFSESFLPFPFFSDEEWQRFLRRTSRQTSRCSSGRRRCSRSRPGRGLVIHRTGTEKGKRGIPHQAQSQHLAVEHLGLFRLCRCDEGDKIAVSEHLAHLLLKYSAPNQWPSVSVHMKLPQV